MRIVHFDSFAYLCVLTAFLSFLPLGNGIKIFAGMKHTGIFLLILSFAILLMLHLPAILATIIIAIVIALALMIAYYTLWER
jgi:flagellar biosynthesis component FlhA